MTTAPDPDSFAEQDKELRAMYAWMVALTVWPTLPIRMLGLGRFLPRVREARNTSDPTELDFMARRSFDGTVRLTVAKNPATSPKTLARLAKDRDRRVRAHAAAHPSTPSEALSSLTLDRDRLVRQRAAGHPKTPADALVGRATTTRFRLGPERHEVAMNSNSPPEALAILALDRNVRIRLEVAQNLSTPSDALDRLLADKDPRIRGAAAASLATQESVDDGAENQ